MSRMTAAQVISLGEYLEHDFDPGSLTVSQLLGVLGYHNIIYPTPYSKPKLVQLFNEEVKSKSRKLKKERIKKENSIASDDGITDGITGGPLAATRQVLARRSSRRLSRASTQEQDTSPVRPDPPKRRRSSAQPNLGGPPRKVSAIQPALIEESEPEETELPIRKVGRSKKTSEAGAQARRVSNPVGEDSGWEDNNIFQSGAESSSPARPSPIRPKTARKSGIARKSRKSMSAPPQMLPSSSPPQPSRMYEDPRFSPPQSDFNPQLPSSIPREPRVVAPKFARTTFTPMEHRTAVHISPQNGRDDDDELNLVDGDSSLKDIKRVTRDETFQDLLSEVEEAGSENDDAGFELKQEQEQEQEQTETISRRIAQGGKAITNRPSSTSQSGPTLYFFRLLYGLLIIAACGTVVNYKRESALIGYCDMGSNTNSALEKLKGWRDAVEACNTENRTLLYLPPLSVDSSRAGHTSGESKDADPTPCPLPPLLPLPVPETCTPCPEHATCTQYSVACNMGYLLRPYPLLFFLPPSASPRNTSLSSSSSPIDLLWRILSEAFDGLPGLGSIALPPRCVEDPKRKRNIGVLGKAIESMLGQERGRRLCASGKGIEEPIKDADGGEAKTWGVELEKLRDAMKRKTAPHLLVSFDDTFNEAIQQLIQWGGVIISEDVQGKRYVAHKTPDLTWDCMVTVKIREIWAEWRATFLGTLFLIAIAWIGRARKAQKEVESKRVAELVQIALDTLRNQELAHHTDPVTASHPYLSSLQLRDLILQDEHSVSTRKRLWNQVERVVEGNANVRANLQEVKGGDEMRVWHWVGSAGRGPVVRNQVGEVSA